LHRASSIPSILGILDDIVLFASVRTPLYHMLILGAVANRAVSLVLVSAPGILNDTHSAFQLVASTVLTRKELFVFALLDNTELELNLNTSADISDFLDRLDLERATPLITDLTQRPLSQPWTSFCSESVTKSLLPRSFI
jgi:hypothetical protein